MAYENSKFYYFMNLLLLNLTQVACAAPDRTWVFWYYSNNGRNKNCGNYCILTFSIVGFIILLIILCGILRCYFIRKQSRKEGIPLSFKEILSKDSILSGF